MNPRNTHPQRTMQYSQEIVAEVLADYQIGMSFLAIEKKRGIPQAQVRRWVQQYGAQRGATLSQNARELVGQKVLELLLENMDAEIAIVRQTKNTEWMDKQGAGELAILYGTIHDKSIHLISSMQSKAQQAEQDNLITDDLGEEEEWADSYDVQQQVIDGDQQNTG